ncbi:glutamate-cysteine ligase family protein [Noviherbaspirillum agri]
MSDEEEPQTPPILHAFDGIGIELEYMIVDRESLSIRPIADRLIRETPGSSGNEVDRGLLGWSNELVLHLVEIKNRHPVASLSELPGAFHAEVRHINTLLELRGACLMPGAMHPWMDPQTETHLWPHDNQAIYRAYDAIFGSRNHGWSNLQSMHVNLPFAGDEEFTRLHAAVRLVLPILPALAASSPIADGCVTGWADYRMRVYCDNAPSIPSIAGMVIPETITSRADYEQRILARMYKDIAPFDPDRVLQHEWLNSRGAIARFDRSAIEIRVIDTQECPQADLAVAAATRAAVKLLYQAGQAPLVEQQEMPTNTLAAILQDCIRDADQTVLDNADYLRLLGFPGRCCRAEELWECLVERMMEENDYETARWRTPLQTILRKGTLARRILQAVGSDYSRPQLHAVYRELSDCLQEGRMFEGQV